MKQVPNCRVLGYAAGQRTMNTTLLRALRANGGVDEASLWLCTLFLDYWAEK